MTHIGSDMDHRLPVVGLLLGDPSGIGPEVGAKLLSQFADDRVRLVAVAAPAVLSLGLAQAGLPDLDLPVVEQLEWGADEFTSPTLLSAPTWEEDLPKQSVASVEAGLYCLRSLSMAVSLSREGHLDGFTYAPMNKASLQMGGSSHVDDMGLLSALFELDQPGSEINVLDDLCTARVTSHIPLAEVSRKITPMGVLEAIRRLDLVLGNMGYSCRNLAVAGLNPHASDGGLFGDEETEVLEPAIAEAQDQGICVIGPVSPDTVFVRARNGEFGGVVTMYHDQGQIAMKLLGFDRGATFAAGLPVPVTTTAHGTAFDITGTGKANPGSLTQALNVCIAQVVNSQRMHEIT